MLLLEDSDEFRRARASKFARLCSDAPLADAVPEWYVSSSDQLWIGLFSVTTAGSRLVDYLRERRLTYDLLLLSPVIR